MLTCTQAEKSILGALLLLGHGPIPQNLAPQDFYYQRHEYLYRVIETLHEDNRGFDTQCVLRALTARLPVGTTEEDARARVETWRQTLDLLLSEAQVSMLADHARLVVEAACFRSLKARSLEMQDAAMRGDAGALGRALQAAHVVYGRLEGLSGGPALKVVKESEAA